ncbi:hypothetical protein [Serratia sp. M24T3]|uniref:hypothetical protein n=1 Tax=Serratia sp. M24T3 TaxID=932213 RepID=UPI00025BA806|nr:hypothetical protein [Serratia sp. M24T3]EIC82162.1 hypothetical protein SPM24T3_23302 [Serratia sp. M24T3]
MKHIQLAKLYRGSIFFGYGIAVEGEWLCELISTEIISEPNQLPVLNAKFYLKEQQAENPIIINLDDDDGEA